MAKEPAKIVCPLADYGRPDEQGEWQSEYFVTRPGKWLGKHARRRDEAVEKADGRLGGGDLLKFGISMSLADDWNLPGMNGNPEKWDFDEVDLDVILWVNREIFDNFQECYRVKKN